MGAEGADVRCHAACSEQCFQTQQRLLLAVFGRRNLHTAGAGVMHRLKMQLNPPTCPAASAAPPALRRHRAARGAVASGRPC